MATVKEAVEKIRQVGLDNARITQLGNGKAKIEIKTKAGWVSVLSSVNSGIAEDILRQATNKVILG